MLLYNPPIIGADGLGTTFGGGGTGIVDGPGQVILNFMRNSSTLSTTRNSLVGLELFLCYFRSHY